MSPLLPQLPPQQPCRLPLEEGCLLVRVLSLSRRQSGLSFRLKAANRHQRCETSDQQSQMVQFSDYRPKSTLFCIEKLFESKRDREPRPRTNANQVVRNQCSNPKKEFNVAVDNTDNDVLILSVESSVDSWVMDSGALVHATHNTEGLKNLKFGDFGKVRLANNEVLDVTGMGDIDLKTPAGSLNLKNVRIIPSLKRRLILVGQLDNQGHEVKFKNGQWKVVKGNLVMARGKKKGSLYLINILSQGVTVPIQKNKVWFTESRGHKRVTFASEKPRAKVKIQSELQR
ncbi:hypothetical protein E3N88_11666 [Mikania micrantha]|uniref:Retrovirus-related Pol polyprotein from transposon TNT 1-94-like beta-barrel domain-containing protein n=1 Tax=Mikania micrantha TaxID=192012 RepID=A0A5N6P4P8_9ASTR|nr:hypothetical protein E3N88_11666 [Mikania micrantha]